MKKFIIGLTALLISSPVYAHPRNLDLGGIYHYPKKDVMVKNDWKRCKKIKYVTRYDKWGWYTERKISDLTPCFKFKNNKKTRIKVIIKD